MILETITEEMEILPTSYSRAESAQENGEREARNRTKRGYPYKCIGVVEISKLIQTKKYVADGVDFYEADGYDLVPQRGYHPVLVEGE